MTITSIGGAASTKVGRHCLHPAVGLSGVPWRFQRKGRGRPLSSSKVQIPATSDGPITSVSWVRACHFHDLRRFPRRKPFK